jgi:oligosaccharide repeat unit polymerase
MPHRSSESAVLPGVLRVLLACAAGLLIVQLAPGNHLELLPFVLTCLVAVAAVLIAGSVSGRMLSPFAGSVAAYAVIFGAMPIVDGALGVSATSESMWVEAGWLGVGGLILLSIGYLVGLYSNRRGSAKDTKTLPWPRRTVDLWANLLILVSLLLTLQRVGSIGGVRSLIARFGLEPNLLQVSLYMLLGVFLVVPGVLLHAGSWVDRPSLKRGLFLFGLLTPLGVILAGVSGARWRAMTLLVALIGMWHFGFRRLRGWTVIILGMILGIAFSSYGTFRHTRELPDLFSREYAIRYARTPEFGQFRDFVVTLRGVPESLPFQGGRTFLSLIPGLPFETGGALFTSTFYPELWANQVSLPTPLPGELYMNFGLWGILLGMPIFGWILSLPERYFQRRKGSLHAVIIYSFLLVPSALLIRGEFTTFAGFTAAGLVALVVPLRLARGATTRSRWLSRRVQRVEGHFRATSAGPSMEPGLGGSDNVTGEAR